MKVAITGASGFVGGALARTLGQDVIALGRTRPEFISQAQFQYLDLNDVASLDLKSLTKVDVLVHCAARVHIVSDNDSAAHHQYMAINAAATLELAEKAAEAGVRRFIFISSIKACSDGMEPDDLPLTETSVVRPNDIFGQSKAEAERLLMQRFGMANTVMQLVIIRPPLVYGQGVGANFRTLIKIASLPLPLPLGRFERNRRSFVYIINLVDFIRLCLDSDAAAGQLFLVADREVVSTYELFGAMRSGLGRSPRLFNVPLGWLRFLFRCVGASRIVDQLNMSLFVDCSKARQLLGWTPSIKFSQGIRQTMNQGKTI